MKKIEKFKIQIVLVDGVPAAHQRSTRKGKIRNVTEIIKAPPIKQNQNVVRL